MRETICQYCGNRFSYDERAHNYYPLRYCSNRCRAYGGWKKKGERKQSGRFAISLQSLSFLYLDSDLSIPEIAKRFNVHPVTVFRRLKEFGMSRPTGSRRINAPLDKVAILICAPPPIAKQVYQAVSRCVNIRQGVSMKVFDSTYRHPESTLQRVGAPITT